MPQGQNIQTHSVDSNLRASACEVGNVNLMEVQTLAVNTMHTHHYISMHTTPMCEVILHPTVWKCLPKQMVEMYSKAVHARATIKLA